MPALTNFSDIINKTTGGNSGTPEFIWQHIARTVAAGTVPSISAGIMTSWWTLAGQPAGLGGAPGGTARNPTRTTTGALGQADATGGRTKYLIGVHQSSAVDAALCSIWLGDRLADISGFSATSTSLQNITGLTAARYTGTAAAGNAIMVEIYTGIGGTQQTLTINYTNENGASKTTTALIGGANQPSRTTLSTSFVTLAAGDLGVRSVESVQLGGSTGSAGDYGITITRPLLFCGISGNRGAGGSPTDILTSLAGPVEIKAGACLYFFGLNASNTLTFNDIGLQFVES
jgi:hypothetical protein